MINGERWQVLSQENFLQIRYPDSHRRWKSLDVRFSGSLRRNLGKRWRLYLLARYRVCPCHSPNHLCILSRANVSLAAGNHAISCTVELPG